MSQIKLKDTITGDSFVIESESAAEGIMARFSDAPQENYQDVVDSAQEIQDVLMGSDPNHTLNDLLHYLGLTLDNS